MSNAPRISRRIKIDVTPIIAEALRVVPGDTLHDRVLGAIAIAHDVLTKMQAWEVERAKNTGGEGVASGAGQSAGSAGD